MANEFAGNLRKTMTCRKVVLWKLLHGPRELGSNPDIDHKIDDVLETIRLTPLADINEPHPASLRSATLPEDGEG